MNINWIQKLKIALASLALLGLTACGGAGGGGEGIKIPPQSIVTGVVNSNVIVIPPSEYDKAGAVTSTIGGGLTLISNGANSTKIKQGDIVYLPPGAAGSLTMPFAGRVMSMTTVSGVVTTQINPVNVEDVYQSLSWDIDTKRSGARIAGVIAPPGANVKFSQSPAVTAQAGVFVGGNLNYADSKLTGTIEVTRDVIDKTGPVDKKVTLFATVDLTGIGVTTTGNFDITKYASTGGWAEASAIITGTVSGKLGVKGEGSFPNLASLISNTAVFNDLKHQAGGYFELQGLEDKDKKGRFPLGGVVLLPTAATAFKGNMPDSALVFLAQVPSVVLWVYMDASGKISVSGELGKRFTESTFEQGYKFNAVGAKLKATKVSNTSIKGIEWYGKGVFDVSQRLGVNVAADVFVGGIRPLNVNTFIGAELAGKLSGEGVLAEYPTKNLTGNVCLQNSIWAGVELNANFRIKTTVTADTPIIKLDYGGVTENQFSSKVYSYIGTDGAPKNFLSECATSGLFGVTASIAGVDPIKSGNVLVNLDFTSGFTNATVKPLVKTWKAIVHPACILPTCSADLIFDIPDTSAGVYQVSLPSANTYSIELQANSDVYNLIRSATTSINVPAAPQLDFNVTAVNGNCTALTLTAIATPYSNGGRIVSYKWVIARTGTPVQSITATTSSINVTLPSCGITSINVTSMDSNGLSTSTAQTIDTTQLIPIVYSVSPSSATLNTPVAISVSGINLPLTAVLSMADAVCQTPTNRAASGFTVSCTPQGTATGVKVITVKTDTLANGGTVIDATKTVNVSAANTTAGKLFPTGVDALGNALAAGSPDPHYTMLSPNQSGVVMNADPAWIPDSPTSMWIWETSSGQPTFVTRTFRTTVDLTGLNPNLVSVLGTWATDNGGMDILINGVSTGNGCGGFQAYCNFAVNSGFVAGVNTLDFVVTDVGVISGFRVDTIGIVPKTPTPNPFTVAANDAVGTAFNVPSGATSCLFNATGTWDWAVGQPIDANGMIGVLDAAAVNPLASVYSLTAKMSNGTFQSIGASQQIPVSSGSVINFMMNDGYFLDNTGALSVTWACQ